MYKQLMRLALIFGLVVSATAVAAQAPCGQRDTLIQRLESKYNEHFAAGGLQTVNANQAMLEIWTSEETGTFTILMTKPSGVSCIVAAGTDFFHAMQKPQPKGTPS